MFLLVCRVGEQEVAVAPTLEEVDQPLIELREQLHRPGASSL